MNGKRIERDFLGELEIPADVYYGIQTQRAIENFRISGLRFGRRLIHALGLVKLAAAEINLELRQLDSVVGGAIIKAASEVSQGNFDDQFVVDVYQSGSGTSTNMNANEVIANRANEILGLPLGQGGKVHPNDHVNLGQSSNDVIPTAIHLAAIASINNDLLPAMELLRKSMASKADEYSDIVKAGRTHLQDATPMTLGQELGGYASQIEHGIRRIEAVLVSLSELPIGGTAVGTGINTHPEFAPKIVVRLGQLTGVEVREADDHFEAQSAKDALVETSGALKVLAVSLMKICNDLRLLGSGPRTGLGEIGLPAVQPGSSLMPGKVNPVIPEAVCQVAAQVIGNDAAITVAGFNSSLNLNTMMPMMAHNVLSSIELLANASRVLSEKCIDGIRVNVEVCRRYAEASPAIATILNSVIGYERASEVVKESVETGKSVKEIVIERGLMTKDEAERTLDPIVLSKPHSKSA